MGVRNKKNRQRERVVAKKMREIDGTTGRETVFVRWHNDSVALRPAPL